MGLGFGGLGFRALGGRKSRKLKPTKPAPLWGAWPSFRWLGSGFRVLGSGFEGLEFRV